jgi:heme-degrading monooxygenase HmoA
MQFREMDERVSYQQQLRESGGPVVLINQFTMPVDQVEQFLNVWANNAEFMKRQPGCISTQLTAARRAAPRS